MKPMLLLGCALLAGTAAYTQLSFLPYAGFEQSRNTLGCGNALSAAASNGHLKAGLKLDYRLKSGHSPFLNLTTSPAPVSFRFGNDGSLAGTAAQGGLLFRLEGGYQYSSKPIFFGKKSPGAATALTRSNTRKMNACGSASYRLHCGAAKRFAKIAPVNQVLNLRLQPSLAVAYVPAAVQHVTQTADGFTYAAGSWKTAVVPAMGFEFAKGNQRLFTLGVFYTRPLGQNEEKINRVAEGKTAVTNLSPNVATWGLTFGIPFGTAKASVAKRQTTEKKQCNRGGYRHCRQLQ